ncbi:MAG: polyprenyl synthetase family protein [Acidobacteria bacterium]|nr:polyprenyl synthetase family protein [Acidobacteriota bacterium]
MSLLPEHVDESPHLECSTEWWFVHGRFQGREAEERFFMAAVFRLAGGFSALVSVLDPATGRQRTSSRIDCGLWAAALGQNGNRGLDAHSAPAVLDELRTCGLPREFECPNPAPELSSAPLRLAFADIVLSGRDGGFALVFDEPETSRPLRFELTPAVPRLEIGAARTVFEPEAGMCYVAWPGLRLEGTAGDQAVSGEAWLDHQWGDSSWLRSKDSPPRVRGWDWLGFRLGDGSDWVVSAHWDGQTHQEIARHLTLRDASGAVRVFRAFEWTPLRWWTSPATRIRFPVGWRLSVPELDAELEFAPLADQQEIRVFGPMRAIWEGAGRVRGVVRGRPVDGAARLEGQGYGYIFSLAGYLRGWAEQVDGEMARFLPKVVEERDMHRYAGPPAWAYESSSCTSMLSQPLWDLMDRDGKRWRAIFSFLLLDALGRDPEPFRDILFVVPELFHNASLIIDDIQDGSLTRRGDPAIHRRYGLDVAISAANTSYFLPFLVILDHVHLTPDERHSISSILQRLLIRAHLGQSLDLYWTRLLDQPHLETWMADSLGPKILQMYAFKTSAVVEGLSEVALLLAGTGEPARRAVLEFARAFGLAFQFVDDVNNFSASPDWRKQRGEDLGSGKVTYLIYRALQSLPPAGRARLSEILCQPALRGDPQILAEGIDLIHSSGACGRVRQEAHDLVAPAWRELSRFVPPSASKTELRLLWEGLVELHGA